MSMRPGQAKGPNVSKNGTGSGGLTAVAHNDSASVQMTGDGTSGNPLQSIVKISASAGNQLSVNADGLFVAAGGGGGLSIFERNNFLANCESNLQTDGASHGMGGSGAGGCASLFRNVVTGNVTKIGTYFLTASGGNFIVGLYDDDPVTHTPRNLLATSVSTAPIAGFQAVTIPSTPLTAGVNYWIAISFDRTNLAPCSFHAEPLIFDVAVHNPFVYAFYSGTLNLLPASGSGVWSPNAAVHCIPYLNLQS